MIAKPQPWYPGINRQHPLAPFCQGAWIMNDGAGSVARDILNRAPGTFLAGSQPSWEGGEFGYRLRYSTNESISTPATDWRLNDRNECTVIGRAAFITDNSGVFEFTVGGSLNSGITLHAAATGIIWRVLAGGRGAGSGDVLYGDSPSYPFPRATTIATYSSSAGQFLYADGQLQASNVSFTGDFDGTITGQAWLGALGANVNPLTGDLDFVILYNKAFSRQEVQEAFADPFAPFRPNMTRRVAILAPQAVGGVTMPKFYHHYQRNTG